ncbi:hypothetical protein ACHAXH_009820 [Discostella pseudostelligera]
MGTNIDDSTQSSTPIQTPLLKTVMLTDDTSHEWAIVDSGASSHFLTTTAPFTDMQPTNSPIWAQLPNGDRICTTHTCRMQIEALSDQARLAHILPNLLSHSLISVINLCNAGCEVTLNKIGCTIKYKG